MSRRWAALALFLLLVALSLPGGTVARAQTVEEAEQSASQAENERDSAYAIVDDAVANRDQVESELFEALSRYEAAVTAVADATRKLDIIKRNLAAAEANSVGVSKELRDQAVEAYMEAVLSPGSIVVGTGSAEQAMVVQQFFSAGQTESLARLDFLAVQQADLDRLRTDFADELSELESLEATLAIESESLASLFAQADEAVADAYARAAAADAAYRAALSEVDRARAAQEERDETKGDPTTTTTTTSNDPPPTGSSTSSSTTTTTKPPGPPPTLKPQVERWRSLVAAYFPAGLVDEALQIIQCESLGDPDAVNPYSGAAGLFQFIPGTWAVASVEAGVGDASVFDPEANIAAAAWLSGYYQANGRSPWAPWACSYYLP
ncbi:MAG: transglycosylase SLT domain-containing protein [Acidimicrobiia bacterium]|nr:transglycosylase SLT domain-containing protein [Acidimicrobiia bacterium]MDH4307645.1 transglycosylase SLT domain-containing protein [Acidimicrobiia bacterium]MDH5294816.1 transglycosylase SLT domain-containing protein [Acidimicrobiia bacterium]